MWRLTLILNSMLIGLFSLLSYASLTALSYAVDFDVFHGKPLPAISAFALSYTWICAAIPLVWLIAYCLLLGYLSRHPNRNEVISLHTSTTLFVGILMLATFCLGGILPFIPLIVGLRH